MFFGFYKQMVYLKQARKTCASNERKGFGGKWWWPNAEIYQIISKSNVGRHKMPFT
jgi:hypothetical protein